MAISPLNALVARLESVKALDGPGQAAGRMVRGLIRDGAPKGVLSGAWLGHAVHPMMTDIPIGAWTSSVVLDWMGGRDSRSAADRLILAGVLAAGATFATGWSDWAEAGSSPVAHPSKAPAERALSRLWGGRWALDEANAGNFWDWTTDSALQLSGRAAHGRPVMSADCMPDSAVTIAELRGARHVREILVCTPVEHHPHWHRHNLGTRDRAVRSRRPGTWSAPWAGCGRGA